MTHKLDSTAPQEGKPGPSTHDPKGTLETPRISLAQAILKYREYLGLTQTAMAKVAGISRQTYCAIESGRQRNPRMSSIWFFISSGRFGLEAESQCNHSDDHYHLS